MHAPLPIHCQPCHLTACACTAPRPILTSIGRECAASLLPSIDYRSSVVSANPPPRVLAFSGVQARYCWASYAILTTAIKTLPVLGLSIAQSSVLTCCLKPPLPPPILPRKTLVTVLNGPLSRTHSRSGVYTRQSPAATQDGLQTAAAGPLRCRNLRRYDCRRA